MKGETALRQEPPHLRYWQRVRSLTLLLLTLWGTTTFSVIFFARQMASFTLFGWPLPFYMAAQGLVFGYLLLIGTYVLAMKRLDRLHAEEQSP